MKTCPTCQKTYPDDFSLCPHDGTSLTTQVTATEAQLAAGLSRRFRLVRRLGAGGMGTVFLAEQIGVGNRPVALKVLNRKLLDDPEFLLRFQNEAGSTGRIHHPNVVTIYESAQADDGTPYIAMEFLEGESLRELVKKRGALPVAEVVEIIQQVADGLDAAHDLGIIHRDLKPDNIFLTRDKRGRLVVKVVDFGIAKLRESTTHTMTGMVLGTPAYMSYEQASGMRSDELDARSDIYLLGVVVYEMLTGRVPFHSDTPVGYLRKRLMEEPPPLSVAAPGLGVSSAVENAVMRALTKERDQRYSSALDFARDLASTARVYTPGDTPPSLESTRIVSLPENLSKASGPQPLMPLASTAQAKVTGGQVLLPAPSGPTGESPISLPGHSNTTMVAKTAVGTKPAPPAVAANPQSRVRNVLLGLALFAIIVVGAWHFSQPGRKPPQASSPSTDATSVTGKETNLEVPASGERREPTLGTAPETVPVANGANTLTPEAETSVRNAVDAWVQAFRSRDATALTDSYAPVVEKYFLRSNVSREEMSQINQAMFTKLPEIRTYTVNAIQVDAAPGETSSGGVTYGRATATFRKMWDALESNGKEFSGEEIEQLTFKSSPQGWKIVREEELKIIRVSRR